MEGFDQAQVYLVVDRSTKNRTLIINGTDGEIDEFDIAKLPQRGWFNMEKRFQFNTGDLCYLTLDSKELAIVIEECDGLQAKFFVVTEL